MLLIDALFFESVSLPGIRSAVNLPIPVRVVLPVYAAVTEETIYRLGIMTGVVWLGNRVAGGEEESVPVGVVWLGILVAAVLFGLVHVANVPDAPHPIIRAVALNGFAGIVSGWMYWRNGFEAAVMTHFVANATIYLGVASLLGP